MDNGTFRKHFRLTRALFDYLACVIGRQRQAQRPTVYHSGGQELIGLHQQLMTLVFGQSEQLSRIGRQVRCVH